MSRKITYIAYAQLIGCLLVVFGHSYPFKVYIPSFLVSLKTFIYFFHMPLFVLISGFLVVRAGSIKRYGGKVFIKKRAIKLMIPYICLSLVGIVPKFLMKSFINDTVEFSTTYFIRAFLVPRENIWGHFWFIPMLFIFATLTPLFVKQIEKNNKNIYISLIVTFILLLIPNLTNWFTLNDIKNNLFYYVFGMYLAYNVRFEKRIIDSNWVLILLPLSIILFMLNSYLYIFEVIKRIIVALLMIFFVLRISNRLPFSKFPFFISISENIFPIFILSWPCQVVVEVVANRILGFNIYLVMPLMFTSGIFGPILVVKLVSMIENNTRIKILSPIIGGEAHDKRTTIMENKTAWN